VNPATTAPREGRLLYRCARGLPDFSLIRRLVHQGIDWPAFHALAEAHHLSALCCRRLESACPELIPQETLASLRGMLRRNVERNLFFAGELGRILARLAEGGVRALAFKGPVLAWWLYDHPGVRDATDLDLLIDEADLGRACALLADLGYHEERADNGASKIVNSEGQIALLRKAPHSILDLHWELAPHAMGLEWNAREAWRRSAVVSVAGRPVETFGTEDQVLYCALHGGKHGWARLSWLADLSALIEIRPPDWARLLAQARRQRLTRALLVGLHLAQELLDTPLPGEIGELLDRPNASARMAREARAHLLDGPPGSPLVARELAYEWHLTEGWARRAQFVWRKITEPSSADWQDRRSTRPLRLMWKYVARLTACW